MSAILIIDADVWPHYFDLDPPEHRSVVEKALKSEQIAVNTIVMMELAHFLVKNLGPVAGVEKPGLFMRFPLVISGLEYRDLLDSVELLKRYSHLGVGGRDATILSMMKQAGVK